MTVTISETSRVQDVLDTLVSEHAQALLSYTRALVNDHHLAEDIVQETLIRAWHNTERLSSTEGSIRGWLLTVARNLVIDWRRSAVSRHESVTADDQDAVEPDHAEAIAAAYEVVGILRELSTEHRAVLFHMHVLGRTAVETARILGVPVGTVKSRQHYALTLLRSKRPRPEL